MSFSQEPGAIRIGVRAQPNRCTPGAEASFRILVLGDFSGASDSVSGPGGGKNRPLRPIAVSRDNIADLPGRLAAHCSAGASDNREADFLRFFRLSDFHPDSLLEKVPALAKLRELRERLMHPATAEKAAAELRSLGIIGANPDATPPRSEEPPHTAAMELPSPANLLDQAILQTSQPVTAPRRGAELPEGLGKLVRRSTAAIRVPQADEGTPAFIAAAETEIARLLRSILHDRAFQALEAAWRGLDFLVKRLPTDAKLKVSLVDLCFPSLKADLASADTLETTSFYDLLVNQTVGTPGGEPWGLIVADYTVEASKVDILVAACMARVAARAGAPLVAGASALLFGCRSLTEFPNPSDWREELPEDVAKAWESLRNQAEAAHLGLVAPRFLLRMPYGPESSPLERVPFNELLDPTQSESYLWGNGSLACAALMGDCFSRDGQRMRLNQATMLEGLPVFGVDYQGEYYLQPCAETLLSYQAAERMLAAGVMPLLTVRDTGSAQLAAWRSVAASGASLAGRWE